MMLKIYKLGELDKMYYVSKVSDLQEVFDMYPFTEHIARHSTSLKQMVTDIASYLSHGLISAMVTEVVHHEDPWTEEKYKRGGDAELDEYYRNKTKKKEQQNG